jgi:hypothetical protein
MSDPQEETPTIDEAIRDALRDVLGAPSPERREELRERLVKRVRDGRRGKIVGR